MAPQPRIADRTHARKAAEPVSDHYLLWKLRRRVFIARIIALVTTLGVTALVVQLLLPNELSSNEGATGTQSTSAMPDHAAHQPTDSEAAVTDDSARPPLLEDQLAAAAAGASRWPTAGDASADGWTLAEDYAPQVGAHYMRYDEIDDVFDVARPEMLLYGGDTPSSPIVGLAYYVINREPEGFVGSEDMWHQHQNVCIGPDGPLWGADGVGICAHDAESPVGNWAWMLHAWVIPEWQSPQGVFSSVNLALP